MNRLFGAKKEQPQVPPPPPPPAKIQIPVKPLIPLSDQQAKLENKVRELSETVTKLDVEARALYEQAKKSKGTAREMYKQRTTAVLRKKKQYEHQLKMYMNQQFTLDQVAFTSESIQGTLDMGRTMTEVAAQQQIVMKDLDIDKLDQIRDQMEDMKYESNYMNEMLSRNYDMDFDEDDLEDELGALEQEMRLEKMSAKKNQKPNLMNDPQRN